MLEALIQEFVKYELGDNKVVLDMQDIYCQIIHPHLQIAR